MPFGIAPSCAEAAPASDTASRHKTTAFIFIGLFFLLGELMSDAGRVFRRLRPRVLWVRCIAGLLLNGERSVKSGAGGACVVVARCARTKKNEWSAAAKD